MAEPEMSMNEILSSIRQMLSQEIESKNVKKAEKLDSDIDEVFILTPQMRCQSDDLQQRMKRVLEKMAQQSQSEKNQTVSTQLQPLLKEWMYSMRPDLSQQQIQDEVNKLLSNP